MTGFSRVEGQQDWGQLTLELRSVNHRYLDVSLRLPDECRQLEQGLREQIGRQVSRGKIDCSVRFQRAASGDAELQIDTALATRLAHASREVDALLYNPAPTNSFEVLRWPGVLQTPSLDPEALKQACQQLLDQAMAELIDSRRREGEKIRAMLEERCNGIGRLVAEVQEVIPAIKAGWQEKMHERLAEADVAIDDARLTQELVLLAQKMDVEEELDRLSAHLAEIQRVLAQTGPSGRRLDFLMQELNREANTLGSKSVAVVTSQASVELKVLIEQMREQVQNIE
ncbi:MAG: YicC/YloC family endoribonuclease [Gammaproteobacteria bacterium]